MSAAVIRELLASQPVVLAPMEDVTDAPFRRACRRVGASLCVTELVAAEHIVADAARARRRLELADDDRPTAIQIYGASPTLLRQAATIAARAGEAGDSTIDGPPADAVRAGRPAFIDLNCGCWIPKIAQRGAGAGWLRDPAAMVAMAGELVAAVDLPVTVKTRIGYGPESHMPIVDLARRLEDVGVAALFLHCRTAQMGHAGPADWSWARRAREAVTMPVVVNGDVRTADDVVRALAETGCAGVMIGRGAIAHPWVFREARALLDGREVVPPTDAERVAMYGALVVENAAWRSEKFGVPMTRRHLGVLGPLAAALRPRVFGVATVAETLEVLGGADA